VVEPPFDAWARAGGGRQLVVYEAVGVPGMIDDILPRAPARSRVLVVGVCMERDLDGVPGAFADLANPDRHCKILVVP
jgi:threonine dehydrogenase-like Zn-dependent dehydrogenase